MRTFNVNYQDKAQLQQLATQFQHHPKQQLLLQVFSGQMQAEHIQNLRQSLSRLFPNVAMLGATSAGEIMGESITSGESIISLSVFEQTQVMTYAVDGSSLVVNGEKIGQAIQAQQAQVAILFCTGTSNGELNNSSLFIDAVNRYRGKTLLAGGQAGTDSQHSDTYVFTEGLITHSGAAVAMLVNPNLQAHSYRSDGWTAVGKQMRVTKVVGDRVYSIDNKTIPEIYRYYLGLEFSLVGQHPAIWPFPLVIERGGLLVKNAPLQEYADGSYRFYRPLAENEIIRFSFCDMSSMEQKNNAVSYLLRSSQPESVFVYSCSMRRQLFGELIKIDTSKINSVATTSGFFTSTEYFTTPRHGALCLIQNATFLSLSEAPRSPVVSELKSQQTASAEQSVSSVSVLSFSPMPA